MEFFIANTGYTGEDGFEIFFPRSMRNRVEQDSFKGSGTWDQTMRPRRTRHTAVGDVLSAQRFRPFARAHAIRGGTFNFCGSPEERIHRARGAVETKGSRCEKAFGAISHDRKSPPPRPHYPVFKGDAKSAKSAAARSRRRSAQASGWPICRRNTPRSTRGSRLTSAGGVSRLS